MLPKVVKTQQLEKSRNKLLYLLNCGQYISISPPVSDPTNFMNFHVVGDLLKCQIETFYYERNVEMINKIEVNKIIICHISHSFNKHGCKEPIG
jgi:hypothetical protein